MLIGYKISDTYDQIPVFSIIIIIFSILIFVLFPYIRYIDWQDTNVFEDLDTDQKQQIRNFSNLLSLENGYNSSNVLISLFYSQYLLQFIINLWLIFIILPYIESKIGRLPFLVVYIVFVFILYRLTLIGLYKNEYPFPWFQGIILMFAGFFYINYYKTKINFLFLISPFETGRLYFRLPSLLIFLPFYYIVQIIIIITVSIHNHYLFLPSRGMFINMLFCPTIGIVIGFLSKIILKNKFFQRYFIKPDFISENYNYNDQQLIEQLYYRKTKDKSLRILEGKYINNINYKYLAALYIFYKTNNKERNRIKLINHYLKSLENNDSKVNNVALLILNNDDKNIITHLNHYSLIKLTYSFYELQYYEIVRLIMKKFENYKNWSIELRELISYLKKQNFMW